jgi:hypothetical protein
LGCKVPDHSGPLAEGWESNKQYSQSIVKSRRPNPDIPDGELNPDDFGVWTAFASCLRDVIFILEGQAYFPETTFSPDDEYKIVDTNQVPIADDGTPDGKRQTGEKILAGSQIGSSDFAAQRTAKLLSNIKSSRSNVHGAGFRYIESANGSDALVNKCREFLPEHVKNDPGLAPMAIQPNFDMDMKMLGWYETAPDDKSGGTILELLYKGDDESGNPIYENARKRQKYYRKHNGKFLNAFEPVY